MPIEHVDPTAPEGVVRVRQAVTRTTGEVHVGAPKTAAGIRDVGIPPHLIRDEVIAALHHDAAALPGGDRQGVEALRPGVARRARKHAAGTRVLPDLGVGVGLVLGVLHADAHVHHVAHGGIVFSFADSAFAFACNTHGNVTVAVDNTITYPAAIHPGDVLTAVAEEEASSNRLGYYKVTVTNQHGAVVALFKGTAYKTARPHFPDETSQVRHA